MIVFLNPWERLIGPNRYLLELLRHAPELAASALVAFDVETEAVAEYRRIGCRTTIWPEVAQLHPSLSAASVTSFIKHHTWGLSAMVQRLRLLDARAIVSNTENLWLGGLAARILGLPHLQVFHALTFAYRFGHHPLLLKAFLRFHGRWSRHLIAVSRTVAEELGKQGARTGKIRVVPNALPVQEILRSTATLPAALVEQIANRFPVLVCAGRLSPLKGQDLLIEALKIVKAEFPEFICVLAGRTGSDAGLDDTGDFERQLLDRIDELGLRDHVLMIPEGDYLIPLLQAAELYVQPSRTESFGRVVAEAILCGTAVAAFRTGALVEVAGAGAVFATPYDTAELGRMICGLVRDPRRCELMVRAGRSHIEAQFDVSVVAPQFQRLLEETLRGATHVSNRAMTAGQRVAMNAHTSVPI